MTSQEIINKVKERYKELEHRGYDWNSFYNGFLEGFSFCFLEGDETLDVAFISRQIKELEKKLESIKSTQSRATYLFAIEQLKKFINYGGKV